MRRTAGQRSLTSSALSRLGSSVWPARYDASCVIVVRGLTAESLILAGDCRVGRLLATAPTAIRARQNHPATVLVIDRATDPTGGGWQAVFIVVMLAGRGHAPRSRSWLPVEVPGSRSPGTR